MIIEIDTSQITADIYYYNAKGRFGLAKLSINSIGWYPNSFSVSYNASEDTIVVKSPEITNRNGKKVKPSEFAKDSIFWKQVEPKIIEAFKRKENSDEDVHWPTEDELKEENIAIALDKAIEQFNIEVPP